MFVADLTQDIMDFNVKLCYKDKAFLLATNNMNWYQMCFLFLLGQWPSQMYLPGDMGRLELGEGV